MGLRNLTHGSFAGTGSTENMQDLMKNPSMSNLLSNPDMLQSTVNMMKNNPAMREMLQKQMPGVDSDTMVKCLDWLSSLARYYARTRSFFANKFVQLAITMSLIAILFYFFGR